MATGMDGNTGRIDLGLSASLSRATLSLDYAQNIARTRAGALSAFAIAQAGFARTGGRWIPDASVVGGLRLTW